MKGVNVSNSTVYFKMKLVKVLDTYGKLQTPSLSLNFFKLYLKTYKASVCLKYQKKNIVNKFVKISRKRFFIKSVIKANFCIVS